MGNQIFVSQAQQNFIFPLRGTISLNGNYGEVRPNHFHAGLDFRTHPSEHMPVYAVADGYVSRIKISSYGYGKVLYITHPNGLVSVYEQISYCIFYKDNNSPSQVFVNACAIYLYVIPFHDHYGAGLLSELAEIKDQMNSAPPIPLPSGEKETLFSNIS